VPGTYACMAVTDTGVGMDGETQEHVFEPFFTTKRGYGTGLGMATIYGIVSQAGGHVFLYSEAGQGTTVKVYLPRVDEPVSRPTLPAVPLSREIGTGAALVVEDEPAVRDLILRFLKRAGYTVLAVEDGAQALLAEADAASPFDILITDVVMPGISGIQLAEEMWSRHPGLAIVLLSGYTPEILDLEHAIARGATFVTKPVSATDLLAAVSRARARGAERESA